MNLEAYSVLKISDLIKEKAYLPNPQQHINAIITDSRKISDTSSAIFFVLKGRKDAHQFIPSLYESGVRSFVYSDENFNIQSFPDANFIYVTDALAALQKLATYHRSQFNYPVIGITGSNGKTIVKEWLFQLMNPDFRVVRSPKSYNSQLGVPLSVMKMNNQHDYAIFEAGISVPQEMEKLEKIIQPTIGILTHIGSSHAEGFSSEEQKITEKFKLFKGVNLLICNSTYQKFHQTTQRIFTWSLDKEADLKIESISPLEGHTTINAKYLDRDLSIQIPFTDKAAIENAIICWASLLAMGIESALIAPRMERLTPVKMRLEMKSGINQTSVIDDSYNSDFSSLEIALDFLNQQNQHPKKTLILSDLLQSGMPAEQLYAKIAQLIVSKKINKFIGIGPDLFQHQNLFKKNSLFFEDTATFIAQLDVANFYNETILLKGSRSFKFEKISKILIQKVHETVLEINLNSLEHNLNYYRSKLKPGVKLMAMVKAFAYGSGSYEIANLLQYNKVDYLTVAYADEGVALRQAGISLPIMVMSPEENALEAMFKYHLEPEVFSFSMLENLYHYLDAHQQSNYEIHLKLDTGMHRLGFDPSDLNDLLKKLKKYNRIKIKSVFSHLVASESAYHDEFTEQQINIFQDFCKGLEYGLGYSFLKHISNTSAISRWPQAQFDMVRLGIGLYGIDNLSKDDVNLQQVATLKTTVSQIKHLKKGETVGYGRGGVMPYDGKTATIKIGYADGYSRALGKGVGSVFIKGQEVFTIGSICMDMCMLDVTGIDVKEGDEVIVFGSQKTLYDMADKLNTIPYEVLTNVSQRVKRVYYYE
jgi:alanine racemase